MYTKVFSNYYYKYTQYCTCSYVYIYNYITCVYMQEALTNTGSRINTDIVYVYSQGDTVYKTRECQVTLLSAINTHRAKIAA